MSALRDREHYRVVSEGGTVPFYFATEAAAVTYAKGRAVADRGTKFFVARVVASVQVPDAEPAVVWLR